MHHTIPYTYTSHLLPLPLLLQHPKNIQIMIDALIYNHASYCLSDKEILSPDKPIKLLSQKILSRILLADHYFTTNIISSPIIPLPCPTSQEPIYVPVTALSYTNGTHTPVAPLNLEIHTTLSIKSSTTQIPTHNILNERLPATTDSDIVNSPLSCNTVLPQPKKSQPLESEACS